MSNRIYLDNAATTPMDPRVWESMEPYFFEHFGNASSLHAYGAESKSALANSKRRIADSIHVQPEEIIFTSSGTEANNLALKGLAYANQSKGRHIIVSEIEHDCILNTCRWLQETGYRISYAPVDSEGIVDPSAIEQLIQKDTILVSVMHVNNEVGTI